MSISRSPSFSPSLSPAANVSASGDDNASLSSSVRSLSSLGDPVPESPSSDNNHDKSLNTSSDENSRRQSVDSPVVSPSPSPSPPPKKHRRIRHSSSSEREERSRTNDIPREKVTFAYDFCAFTTLNIFSEV